MIMLVIGEDETVTLELPKEHKSLIDANAIVRCVSFTFN